MGERANGRYRNHTTPRIPAAPSPGIRHAKILKPGIMDLIWAHFTWWDGCLLGGLVICTVLLIRFYWLYYRPVYRNFRQKDTPTETETPASDGIGLSVVISGQNQYENLKCNLPFWLDQSYSHFEVIVVYDYADEDLNLLLNGMKDPNGRLKCVQVNQNINFFDQEKFSLSIGLKSAAYPYVLLTSADCRPEHPDCLQYMTSAIDGETLAVTGYSLYPARQGSALARFYHDERILHSLGLILAGKPCAASRHALIYHKENFLQNHGYTAFYSFNSGPYDVFAHYLAAPGQARALAAEAARLRYTSRLSFGRWLREERQYLNACNRQPGAAQKAGLSYRYALFGYHLFLLGWLVYTLSARFPEGPYCYLAAGLFALCLSMKCLFQMLVHAKAHRRIGESRLWWAAPCFEWLYLCLCPFWLLRRKQIHTSAKRKKRV